MTNELRAELRRDVRAALHADGATAVLVTHDQGEALSLADQVVVMRDGRAVQHGTPAGIYSAPADPWVARFVGDAMLLPGTASAGRVRTAAGEAPVAQGAGGPGEGPVTVLIRPEQLDLTPPGPGATGPDTARVVRHDFHGHDTLTVIRLPDGTELLCRRLNDGAPAAPGTPVSVRIRGQVRTWQAPAPSEAVAVH